jgi:hypothetical protein
MVINAVFELLTDDWYRTDSRKVSNYPQLIDVRKFERTVVFRRLGFAGISSPVI